VCTHQKNKAIWVPHIEWESHNSGEGMKKEISKTKTLDEEQGFDEKVCNVACNGVGHY